MGQFWVQINSESDEWKSIARMEQQQLNDIAYWALLRILSSKVSGEFMHRCLHAALLVSNGGISLAEAIQSFD